MPQELFGRFSSKADFIRYFKETSNQTQSFMITPVQCNYTCRLSTWSTKTFSRKSSQKKRNFLSLKKLSGSTCRFSTNSQWSTSGLWRRKTNKSRSTSRTSCPKAVCQTDNISSIFWTRSSHNMWSRLFVMQMLSGTLCQMKPKPKKPSKSRTTGGMPSTRHRSFPVSTSFSLSIS